MSWSLNHQHLTQLNPVLIPIGSGALNVEFTGSAGVPVDRGRVAEWLFKKAFEIASVGYCPPDDLWVLFGQDMLTTFAPPTQDRSLVVQTHLTRNWHDLPQKFTLCSQTDKIPMFRGTNLDQASEINMLYMPWVRGWCFFTIPQSPKPCLTQTLQTPAKVIDGFSQTESKTTKRLHPKNRSTEPPV